MDLTLDDFQRFSDTTPLLADLKPSGKYVQEDLHAVGGLPAVMKMLLAEGLLHGDCVSCTGESIAETLSELPGLGEFDAGAAVPGTSTLVDANSGDTSTEVDVPSQPIVRPLSDPIKPNGHIRILYGNVAPTGSVAKITGKEGLVFTGPALCFDCEEDMLVALEEGRITGGEVIVIRYEGPKGGPGMPEMLTPTSAIMGAGLGDKVALMTDGRFSGGSHGFIIGHITPEAQDGGPIALLQNGDPITIDADQNVINAALSEGEFASRRQRWTAPPLKAQRGTLGRYIRTVKSASEGCVTDE